MANEWRAFERVGEKIGLSGDNLKTFTEISKTTFREQWEVAGSDYDSMQDYFLFLEEQVFPQEEVIEVLKELDVDSSTVRELEVSDFSVAESFEEYHKFT
ncbi:hypothetical protein, partial [Microbispora corallina]|uniref:hypothetical protein n=1 Tax=Microbispora corallina TaxID=83302 RepID=UPI0031D9DA59